MATDNEKLYNPRLTVPEVPEIFARWTAGSAAARSSENVALDVPYGPSDAETMDIFRPRGASRAVLMFIHGGYWRMLDKRDQSFLAPAFTAAGVTVAIPNYALCPKVTVGDIVMQMVQASAWLYRNARHFGAPPGPIHVAGHSAGGHLTAMMLAALWPAYASDLPRNLVAGGFSLSGVYDIDPIRKVPSVQADVRLTAELATRASPALLPPATGAPLYTAVGGKEPGGFHAQDKLIAMRWKKVFAGSTPCPDDDHFTILDKLGTAGTPVHATALRMMGLA